MIDCETFEASEIDALYDELDAAAATSMTEHAATCASCATRFERLKATRARVLSVAVEAVPTDFESRIMTAVDAGLATGAAPAVATEADSESSNGASTAAPLLASVPASVPPLAPPATKPEGGATIFQFLSRPSFAVAATFVLVLGLAAILVTMGGTSMEAPMAASESAPAAQVAAESDEPTAASSIALATPAAPAAPLAEQAAGALALNQPSPSPKPEVRFRKAASGKRSASNADETALSSAKALVAAGRCSEALPKLEALRSSAPEADFYAARCIATTRGCAAAAPRFDVAARTNAGTEIGSRATIEGAKCYQATGKVAEARSRLVAAKNEGVLAAEANRELDALEGAEAPSAGAAPHGAGHATPKAARAAPAPPAAVEPAAPPAPAKH